MFTFLKSSLSCFICCFFDEAQTRRPLLPRTEEEKKFETLLQDVYEKMLYGQVFSVKAKLLNSLDLKNVQNFIDYSRSKKDERSYDEALGNARFSDFVWRCVYYRKESALDGLTYVREVMKKEKENVERSEKDMEKSDKRALTQ